MIFLRLVSFPDSLLFHRGQTHFTDQVEDYHSAGEPLTPDQEFDDYEQYFRRHLPIVVRRLLERAARELPVSSLNELPARLVDIVRSAQSQVFEQYRVIRQQRPQAVRVGVPPGVDNMDLDPLPSSSQVAGFTAQQAQQDFQPHFTMPMDFANEFAAFYPQTPLEENSIFRAPGTLDAVSPAMGQEPSGDGLGAEHSDSGYASNDASCPGSGSQWMEVPSPSHAVPFWGFP